MFTKLLSSRKDSRYIFDYLPLNKSLKSIFEFVAEMEGSSKLVEKSSSLKSYVTRVLPLARFGLNTFRVHLCCFYLSIN